MKITDRQKWMLVAGLASFGKATPPLMIR